MFDFVEAHGADPLPADQLTNAGMLTECLVASWELENMKALGRLGDAYGTEAEGQRIIGVPHGDRRPDHHGVERHLPEIPL